MQVSVETTSGLERRLTVGVPAEKVDSAVEGKLQEAQKNVRLDGFRPGKVPMREVKRRFGSAVRNEVLADVMREAFIEAVEQEKLQPAGMPGFEATTNEAGKDLEFVATFEVYPEVELAAFDGVAVEKPVAEVSDEDVDTMIETLRQQRMTWETVERAAADKDMVNIDYTGTKDGEEFAGGKAAGQSLVLGSERMIPGFEDGIIGKSAGDEFTLDLTFPEEYHNEELAGAAVQFVITLNSVSEQKLPEVDEEFYKSFGVDEGGEEAFRQEVVSNMQREMKTASRNKLKNAVMDSLIGMVDVTPPKSLVGSEIQQLKQQMLQQMGGGQGMDVNQLPNEIFTEQAERRVILGLVLGEIIREQNLRADPAKVREAVEELASTYESPEEVVKWYYSNEEQLGAIEQSVIEDQVFDYIIEAAGIGEKQVSYQEVIKAEEPKANVPAGEDEDETSEED